MQYLTHISTKENIIIHTYYFITYIICDVSEPIYYWQFIDRKTFPPTITLPQRTTDFHIKLNKSRIYGYFKS